MFGADSDTYYNTASPNKFFDYIASGLPLIFHFGGPLSDEIEQLGIGLKVVKNSKESLVSCFLRIHHKSGDLMWDREAVREIASERWDKQKILANLSKRLTEVHIGKVQ